MKVSFILCNVGVLVFLLSEISMFYSFFYSDLLSSVLVDSIYADIVRVERMYVEWILRVNEGCSWFMGFSEIVSRILEHVIAGLDVGRRIL